MAEQIDMKRAWEAVARILGARENVEIKVYFDDEEKEVKKETEKAS